MISADADGWQVPIGLTPSEAICIDDSDSESDSNVCRGRAKPPTYAPEHDHSGNFNIGFKCDDEPEENSVTNLKLVEAETVTNQKISHVSLSTEGENRMSSEDVNPFACFAYKPNFLPEKITVPTIDLPKTISTEFAVRSSRLMDSSKESYYSSRKKFRSSSEQKNRPVINTPMINFGSSAKRGLATKCQPSEHSSECISKWHSFALSTDPMELQRFHILIAARLHARCQEGTVRKAMNRLRDHFESNDKMSQSSKVGLTPSALSQASHEEIAPLLSSVLFGNTKAKQIIQAAQDIVCVGGEVPETYDELQKITGIGPKLASILCVVNTRASYLPKDAKLDS